MGAPRKARSAGEGSVYQDERGRWVGCIELNSVDGKRRRRKVIGKTRREAAAKLKALQARQLAGDDLAPTKITVGAFLRTWLEQVVKAANKPRTHRSYSDMVRLHIAPTLGHHLLHALAPAHVQALLNERAAAGLSARMVAYARAVLRRALTIAQRWYGLARNVAALVELPRSARHPITPLTVAQARQLLASVRGHRLEAIYHVALALGLRRGELLGLRWADVDLDGATFKITGTLQWVDGELVRGTPKTAGSARSVPLPAAIVAALTEHRRRQDRERQGADWHEHGYVFPSNCGTPLSPRNLLRTFKLHLRAAGLAAAVRFHDLRHTCASFLVAEGVHPRVIMEILGHSTIAVTMNIYSHVLPENQRQATGRITDLLERPATEGTPEAEA